ncbi:unnamed protein product, partial [Effrenium voratum]
MARLWSSNAAPRRSRKRGPGARRPNAWPSSGATCSRMRPPSMPAPPAAVAAGPGASRCVWRRRWRPGTGALSPTTPQPPPAARKIPLLAGGLAWQCCAQGRCSGWPKAPSPSAAAQGLERELVTGNSALGSCAKASQWLRCQNLLEEMRGAGEDLDVVSWSTGLGSFANPALWQEALGDFHGASYAAPNSFTFCAALTCLEKAAEWSSALLVLEELPRARLHVDTILCNSALSSCEKAGRWAVASAILTLEGCQRSAVTFNAALSALSDGGHWRRGRDIFLTMRAEGLQPNLISGNALMTVYEKSRQWRQAQNFSGQLADLRDAVTCNGLLSAYEKGQQWASAAWQLSQMRRFGPRCSVVSFGALISARGKAWEEALRCELQLRALGLRPSRVTCGALLGACGCGQWRRAGLLVEAAAEEADALGVVEMNAALTAFSESHVTDKALRLARHMVRGKAQADLVTFNTVLALCARGGLWSQALRLLQKQPTLGFEAGDFAAAPDLLSFSAALGACAGGRAEEALGLLRLAGACRVAIDALGATAAAAACAKARAWRQALRLAARQDPIALELSTTAALAGGGLRLAPRLLGAMASAGAAAAAELADVG